MISNTLLGLVVVAASLGPGYIYVRVAERREPRYERTQLLEAAELVVIGALASSIAALVVLSVTDSINFIDTEALARDGATYVVSHPARGLGSFVAILAMSYLGTWIVALCIHRGRPASFAPTSMWHQVLKSASDNNRAFATLELRDRRVVSGYVYAYTALPSEPETSAIALHAPLKARAPHATEPVDLQDQFLIVRGDEVVYLSVQYQPSPALPS